jgi:hypothetical protein
MRCQCMLIIYVSGPDFKVRFMAAWLDPAFYVVLGASDRALSLTINLQSSFLSLFKVRVSVMSAIISPFLASLIQGGRVERQFLSIFCKHVIFSH